MKKLFTLILLLASIIISAQSDYKDVAPVFFKRCTTCHNQNSAGPSFMTYSSIQPWLTSIQNKLNTGEMPPWHPDTTYSRFVNEHLITPAEKNAILTWISNGAVKGDTTQAPPMPVYTKYKLSATPDLVLTVPSFTSNAVSQDSYVCFSLPTGLTQDRILRAYEIVPGNPQIVHHVVVNVDSSGSTSSNLSGNCYQITGDYGIGAYAPGSPPTVFPGQPPLKIGIRIKAGAKIVMQIHYPQGTAGMVDSTQIRLYFYPVGTTGVRNVYVGTPLQNWSLSIPANTVKTFTAQSNVTYTLSAFAIFPHSHKVCTKITNFAYTAGDTVPLIRINRWDFEWQGFYTFKKMPKINAGKKLYARHIYDNTTNNPNIITPQQVYAGTDTQDEMLFDGLQWLVYQPGDENINVDSLLSNDSTFAISVQEIAAKPQLSTYAFPNPFENSVRIGYTLNTPARVDIEIRNMYGQVVSQLYSAFDASGVHEITWDGKSASGTALPAGTYFYTVRADGLRKAGKLTLVPSK